MSSLKNDISLNTIKLIVSDLDGTLLHSDGSISEKTRNYLHSYQNDGGQVILASSRHWSECKTIASKVINPNHGYVVSSNGMQIHDCDGNLVTNFKGLEISDFIKVVEIFPDVRSTAVTDGIDYVYSPSSKLSEALKNFIVNTKSKKQKRLLFSNESEIGAIEKIIVNCHLDARKGLMFERYNVVYDGKSHFEIQAKTTDKLYAIRWLMEKLSLKETEIIVFGDDMNDKKLLHGMANSVAMGNAEEEIKNIAKYTTLTNDDDGVIHFLDSISYKEQ